MPASLLLPCLLSLQCANGPCRCSSVRSLCCRACQMPVATSKARRAANSSALLLRESNEPLRGCIANGAASFYLIHFQMLNNQPMQQFYAADLRLRLLQPLAVEGGCTLCELTRFYPQAKFQLSQLFQQLPQERGSFWGPWTRPNNIHARERSRGRLTAPGTGLLPTA